jgi:hypothetical protein
MKSQEWVVRSRLFVFGNTETTPGISEGKTRIKIRRLFGITARLIEGPSVWEIKPYNLLRL